MTDDELYEELQRTHDKTPFEIMNRADIVELLALLLRIIEKYPAVKVEPARSAKLAVVR